MVVLSSDSVEEFESCIKETEVVGGGEVVDTLECCALPIRERRGQSIARISEVLVPDDDHHWAGHRGHLLSSQQGCRRSFHYSVQCPEVISGLLGVLSEETHSVVECRGVAAASYEVQAFDDLARSGFVALENVGPDPCENQAVESCRVVDGGAKQGHCAQ